MTSAPMSPRIMVANGPARKWLKSMTRMPSSAFGASAGRGVCTGKSDSRRSNMEAVRGSVNGRTIIWIKAERRQRSGDGAARHQRVDLGGREAPARQGRLDVHARLNARLRQ